MRSRDEGFDYALRMNGLDGTGLYAGRSATLGPIGRDKLDALLRAWWATDKYRRVGLMPMVSPSVFDDGAAHRVEFLLGGRIVYFSQDDDLHYDGGFEAGELASSLKRLREGFKPADRDRYLELGRTNGVDLAASLEGPVGTWLFADDTPARLVLGVSLPAKEAKSLAADGLASFTHKGDKDALFGREIVSARKGAWVEIALDERGCDPSHEHAAAALGKVFSKAPGKDLAKKLRWKPQDLEPRYWPFPAM